MRFASPYFLALLLALPLLYRWWCARNEPARIRFPLAIPASISTVSPVKFMVGLKTLALAFLILALARPQTSFKQTERTVSGIDIMLVLDVSASMRIEDLREGEINRLDVAKDVMEGFVNGRENDRIGLLIFSGEPLTLAPPTLDYGLVRNQIRDVEIGKLKDGTGIGDGLALAVSRLKSSVAKSRIIVLLTDGDNNVGQVDPATAGDLAAGFGIKVYTIAVGKEGRVRMPITQRGVFGGETKTYQWFDNALNPKLLEEIAEQTKGRFYRVTDADTLEKVFNEINILEKTEIKSSEKTRYDEKFALPLKLALLMLLFERLFSVFWWRVAV